MKRIVSLLFVVVALVALPMRAEAQIDLSKAFGALLGAATAEQSAEKSPLEIIAEQAPSSRDVVRTWGYERAYFDYLGSNPLAEVALQQLDTTVQAALKREGIVAGSFTLTLRRNGSGFIIWREHAVDGTYDYIEQKGRVTIATSVDGVNYECGGFMKMEGDNLVVMVDARDAMDAFLAAAPNYRNDSVVLTMQGLLESFKGIFICVEFRKF